jgi:hypothetical protein
MNRRKRLFTSSTDKEISDQRAQQAEKSLFEGKINTKNVQ